VLTVYSIVMLAMCFAACYAAPCYGTRMPGKFKLSAEIESYTIFKRDLEKDYGKVRSQQQFFGLSFGVIDWLSIDLKAGGGNIKEHSSINEEADYPSSFAGGYGFRVRVFDKEKIKAVLGFQHISVHPKSVRIGNVKHKAILDDWQWSVLVSREIFKITPYLGARWSRADYIHRREGERKRVMSDLGKGLGLIVGCDLPLSERFWVNLEGQFLDSEAVACRLNFDF